MAVDGWAVTFGTAIETFSGAILFLNHRTVFQTLTTMQYAAYIIPC